jgi:hypothetical protein
MRSDGMNAPKVFVMVRDEGGGGGFRKFQAWLDG